MNLQEVKKHLNDHKISENASSMDDSKPQTVEMTKTEGNDADEILFSAEE